MSAHSKITDTILHRYNIRLRLGDDQDEALEDGIKTAYPARSEDAQADAFAILRPLLDEYTAGVQRRVAFTHAIKKYELSRTYGG